MGLGTRSKMPYILIYFSTLVKARFHWTWDTCRHGSAKSRWVVVSQSILASTMSMLFSLTWIAWAVARTSALQFCKSPWGIGVDTISSYHDTTLPALQSGAIANRLNGFPSAAVFAASRRALQQSTSLRPRIQATEHALRTHNGITIVV